MGQWGPSALSTIRPVLGWRTERAREMKVRSRTAQTGGGAEVDLVGETVRVGERIDRERGRKRRVSFKWAGA